jgi:hypothetical protein
VQKALAKAAEASVVLGAQDHAQAAIVPEGIAAAVATPASADVGASDAGSLSRCGPDVITQGLDKLELNSQALESTAEQGDSSKAFGATAAPGAAEVGERQGGSFSLMESHGDQVLGKGRRACRGQNVRM